MKTFGAIMLAGFGLVLLIAAHGLVAWGGITLSGKIGGWLPWIGGGALAFGLYHAIQAFGLYHVIQHIRGKGHDHSRRSGGQAPERGEAERGPHEGFLVNLGHGFVEVTIFETDVPPRFRLFFHDKHKQARSVPRNATVTIETVRPDDTRQTFDFQAGSEYLESTIEIPEPHAFKAIVHVSHGSHTHTHEVDFQDDGGEDRLALPSRSSA
jgi:nickel/cobalt exporter